MKRREAFQRASGCVLGLATGGSVASCANDDRESPGPAGVEQADADFVGEIGVTTGGFDQQRQRGELSLDSLPAFLNGELGIRLIDIDTLWFTSFNQRYVAACRDLAAASRCLYTNLKVNHRIGDLYEPDASAAAAAMTEARRMVDVAHWLGAPWVRFTLPEVQTLAGDLPAHRQLADYAATKSVRLVVENSGWMRSRADSIALGVAAIGGESAPAHFGNPRRPSEGFPNRVWARDCHSWPCNRPTRSCSTRGLVR
jgi:hypothetical protein